MKKEYLGDGVYVENNVERQMLRLTTEDGVRVTNSIWLDGDVLFAFENYLKRVRRTAQESES